jgi:hypothetical protein
MDDDRLRKLHAKFIGGNTEVNASNVIRSLRWGPFVEHLRQNTFYLDSPAAIQLFRETAACKAGLAKNCEVG